MHGVVLISDKNARLKPCARCGYSLCHIVEARNCPECGLAVRISLSNDRSLHWSNPRWLRWLAAGTLMLALAHVLMTPNWLAGLALEDVYVELSEKWFPVVAAAAWWSDTLKLALTAAGLFALAVHERRYPEHMRILRLVLVCAGIISIVATVLHVILGYPAMRLYFPRWFWRYGRPLFFGSWVLVARDLLVLIYVGTLLQRAYCRRFAQTCGFVLAGPIISLFIFGPFDDVFWAWLLQGILWNCVYAGMMAGFLVWASILFARNAREAGTNWVTDS